MHASLWTFRNGPPWDYDPMDRIISWLEGMAVPSDTPMLVRFQPEPTGIAPKLVGPADAELWGDRAMFYQDVFPPFILKSDGFEEAVLRGRFHREWRKQAAIDTWTPILVDGIAQAQTLHEFIVRFRPHAIVGHDAQVIVVLDSDANTVKTA